MEKNNYLKSKEVITPLGYENCMSLIQEKRTLSSKEIIDVRKKEHDEAPEEYKDNKNRIRILTDLDIIRNTNDASLAFDDLKQIYGDLSNDELLQRACLVELAIILNSKNTFKYFMGVNIYVYGNNAKLYISLERLKSYIAGLSNGVRLSIKSISIFDISFPLDIYYQTTKKFKNNYSSYVTGENGSIYIWNGKVNDETLHMITHKIAHTMDEALGKGENWSLTDKTWSKAMNSDESIVGRKYISDYAEKTNSIIEDFADSVVEYELNQKSFETKAKNRAYAIERILNMMDLEIVKILNEANEKLIKSIE